MWLLLAAGCAHGDALDFADGNGRLCAAEGLFSNGQCDVACGQSDPECSAADFERVDSVVGEINAFNEWIEPDVREIKYCKMSQSPVAFFRGTNHLFWRDFHGDPRMAIYGSDNSRAWLQGDAHTDNMGAFDIPGEAVVYDLNDFDEAIIGDYQWDVWRMAVSIALTAKLIGRFSPAEVNDFIQTFAESYLGMLSWYSNRDEDDDLMYTAANTYGPLHDFLMRVEREESRAKMLGKWTAARDGARRFDLSNDKLGEADAAMIEAIVAAMERYRQTIASDLADIPEYFAVKDVARRLKAGNGSLGTPRYYVLIEGASDSPDDDRILDVKRQGEPSGYAFLSDSDRAIVEAMALSHGERAVVAQRALTNATDEHLGWMHLPNGVYSVRERSPYKETFPISVLYDKPRLAALAEQWGVVLGSAHARGDREIPTTRLPFAVEVTNLTDGRREQFAADLGEIALAYAERVAFDFQIFEHMVAGPDICF